MVKSKFVAMIAALSILFSVPCSALASAAEKTQTGPVVATSADVLSAEEMARYGQMQASAEEKGVLRSEKGGTDATTWTIVGLVVVAAVAIGLAAAIADAD